jgi:hypothetical protein
MKLSVLVLFIAAFPLSLVGQARKPQLPPHPNEPASQEVQTETITTPSPAPPVPTTQVAAPGRLEPDQVKALAHRIWLAEYRLNDLLGLVHPEKWKMSFAMLQSFNQSMDSLHQSLEAEEGWRSQLEKRPESLYLGFMTYVAISAVLPRVDGVAHSISTYENGSFGSQYSQAGNQLFDLQQKIEPHLAALLKNQDNNFLVVQNNLASCQHELNFSEHNLEGHATPVRNIAPEFKGHGRPAHTTTPAAGAPPAASATKAAAKPAAKTSKKVQKK